MSDPKKGFPVPQEVIDYFEHKGLKPAFSWLDVWGEEHAYAFTVAKAVEAELLGAFRDTILASIKAGEGLESWKARILPELQRLGWDRPRKVSDPTGAWKDRQVNFAAPRRLETIFWSNVRSARAAGQWERIQRTKGGLPFLLYVRTTSLEPRVEHLAWVGKILPVDDPFWETHFPPNGWNCKCSVRQVTRREATELLREPGYSDGAGDDEGATTFVNKRTGEVSKVPIGVDPGWGTNPGLARARNLAQSLQARLDEAGPAVARERIAELMASPTPNVLMRIDERLKLPVAVGEGIAAELGAKSPIVMASNDAIHAKTGKPGVDVTLDDFKKMQAYLDQGRMIDEGQRNKRSVFVDAGGKLLKIIVQMSETGFLRIASIFTTSGRRLAQAIKKAGEKQ